MVLLRSLLLGAVCALLLACTPAPAALTSGAVTTAFSAAGIKIENVAPANAPANSPLPKSFKENVTFTVPRLNNKGGQFFVCDTKKNCDAIYAYFDALKALAGPYTYQSPNGLLVAQLDSGLTPAEANQFEQVVMGFK